MVQEPIVYGHKPSYNYLDLSPVTCLWVFKEQIPPSVHINKQTGHRTPVARTANGFQRTIFTLIFTT